MNKKILTMLIITLFVLTISGCGNNVSPTPANPSGTAQTAGTSDPYATGNTANPYATDNTANPYATSSTSAPYATQSSTVPANAQVSQGDDKAPISGVAKNNNPKQVKYSYEQALEIAKEAAKNQFGDKSFVIPAGGTETVEVTINGTLRDVYQFGADNTVKKDGTVSGLYHVDANTGEVFDNGSGKMVKVN